MGRRKMNRPDSPRKRAPNFSSEEIDLLVDVVYKYREIIECKKSDGSIWEKKDAAWQQITEDFNEVNIRGLPRAVQTLHDKYEGLKTKVRMKAAQNGGDIDPGIVMAPFEGKILDMLSVGTDGYTGGLYADTINVHDDLKFKAEAVAVEWPTVHEEEQNGNSVDGNEEEDGNTSPDTVKQEDEDEQSCENWTGPTPPYLIAPNHLGLVQMVQASAESNGSINQASVTRNAVNSADSSSKSPPRPHKEWASQNKKAKKDGSAAREQLAEMERRFIRRKVEALEEEHRARMEILAIQKLIETKKLAIVQLELEQKQQC